MSRKKPPTFTPEESLYNRGFIHGFTHGINQDLDLAHPYDQGLQAGNAQRKDWGMMDPQLVREIFEVSQAMRPHHPGQTLLAYWDHRAKGLSHQEFMQTWAFPGN